MRERDRKWRRVLTAAAFTYLAAALAALIDVAPWVRVLRFEDSGPVGWAKARSAEPTFDVRPGAIDPSLIATV